MFLFSYVALTHPSSSIVVARSFCLVFCSAWRRCASATLFSFISSAHVSKRKRFKFKRCNLDVLDVLLLSIGE
ncbi:hypothetical protein HDK77DRAFT_153742 [Phyllosticta capitalensis]